jgi:hypothetical protein
MTTSSLKTVAPTSPSLLRNVAPTAVRETDSRLSGLAPRVRPTGSARRFLNVLMNSLSAWAV